MKIAAVCLALILGTTLHADQPPAAIQQELVKLDKQIQDLSLKIDDYRHKSLNFEAEAQRVMMSDFAKYTDRIKEAEQYEELTRNSESQLKLLLQQRRTLIESSKTR